MASTFHLLPIHLALLVLANPALCYSAVNLSNGNLSVGIWNSSNPPATNSPLNKFLQCAGLPTNMSLSSQDHVQNLRGILEAALDVYSFMRSTFDQNPIMEMLAAISANPDSYVFHNVDLVKIWFQVKLKPLLSTVSRQFLSCLSTRNFTCQTYQTVVQELNSHFPTMDPFRQKWIYLSFMYPFLAGNNSAGCVSQGDTSEDWLTKNFGAFSVVAKFKDFITLNAVFNGLEVLHHLTQEQKAELLLNPGASLDNSSLIVIFQNLFLGNQFPNGSIALNNTTTPAPMTTLGPPRTQQNPFEQAFKTFQRFFKPLGSFVKEIVSLTQGNLTNMKSTTFAQGIMNWSLAELAGQFGKNVTEASKSLSGQTAWLDSLNATDVTAWFQHVVAPVLRRFLPANQTEIPQHLTAVFYHLFSLNNSTAPQVSAPPDVCTITLKNPPDAVCSAISTVEHLTQVFSCISHTNLSLTEGNMMVLLTELSQVLNSLIQQYSSLNFSSAGSQLADIFGQLHAETFTEENLQDVSFVSLWFQIKLKPLLPSISNDFLSCLSTKNFTCETFQALVRGLSDNISPMDKTRQQSVYTHFIRPFLSRRNAPDRGCASNTNGSMDWLVKNFGTFSAFAPLQDFYDVYANFSALDSLEVLTPKQTAELIVRPQNGPAQKRIIVDAVFDYVLESPRGRHLEEILNSLVKLSTEINIGCDTYQLIFQKLNQALPSVPSDTESVIWRSLNDLMLTAPVGCVTTCFTIAVNETRLCTGVNSTELQLHLNTGDFARMLCNFSVKQYACASLTQITAENLASLLGCKLTSHNVTTSKETWKLLFTKVAGVLDSAIAIFSNMSLNISSPVMSDILQVIGDIRMSTFNGGQFVAANFTNYWLHGNLRPFLSSASGEFLNCLSSDNLTCEIYQNVLKEFSSQFFKMDPMRKILVYKYFIFPFLSKNTTDPACISNTNGSADWLLKNFGPFSVVAPLPDLLTLNKHFSPLQALDVLSPEQTAQLLVLPLSGIPDKTVVINTVFEHLLSPPNEGNLVEFLNDLVTLSRKEMISCDSYKIIFSRLKQAWQEVPAQLQSPILMTTNNLMMTVSPDCNTTVFNKQCQLTPVNETKICSYINSTAVDLSLTSGNMSNKSCNFSIEQYACSSMTRITALQLSKLLKCGLMSNMTLSQQIWKLFVIKNSAVLDDALDHLYNMSFTSTGPSTSNLLDVIGEIRIDSLSSTSLANTTIVNLWFQKRLYPFLPSVSPQFLSCLSTKNLSCETYQAIVKSLSDQSSSMNPQQQQSVYTDFIVPFLTRNDSTDASCISNTNGSFDWLLKNFGHFFTFAPLADLEHLNRNFSGMNTLPLLSVSQLAEVAYTPGQLNNPKDVNNLMSYVSNAELEPFFNIFSSVIKGHENEIPLSVRSAMLQQVFHRVNLSNPSVSDAQVLSWLQQRLKPLLINMSVDNVTSYFDTVRNRSCQTIQQAVELLYSIQSTLPEVTQREIYNNIVISMKEPSPLRCYQNNSFYSFLESTFLGFQFPNISTVLSLMPDSRKSLLINSMSLSDLARLLHQPNFVDNSTDLCTIFNYYHNTSVFVEKANVSDGLKQQILPCVWPLALSSENKPDVDAWFKRLGRYLPFLNKDLISSSEMLNTSCLAFQKFVSALGNGYNYSRTNFNKKDVYATIKNYLSTGAKPKCYNATNPDLNSTAWFAEYIGMFITFTTLDDLNSFGSTELQVFATNLANIQLFNNTGFPQNISSFYTELIYQQDPNFNPLLLPLEFRCNAPGSSYTQLNNAEAITVLTNLSQTCSEIDPQIATALAGDLTVSTAAITALGQESSGLTTEQILKAPPSVIVSSLPILSTVNNWNQGQMIAIIQVLTSAGVKINNSAQLLELGTLVEGVPSAVFTNTDPAQLLQLSRNAAFIANLMNAPPIVQYTFINQILSISSTPQSLLVNVPDAMANKIPRSLLTAFPSDASVIQRINMKNWTQDQAVLFFDTVSNAVSDPNTISANVLQGFTCSRVQSFSNNKVLNIIKACQSRGQKKVSLSETQLTCMYNYVQDGNATAFTQYPSDILLYYNYQLVRANCSSYFVQLGTANFDVISDSLAYIKETLLQNAKTCLGISGTKINSTNLKILGNMVCTLNGSYIVSSDPLILEQLKNCNGFTSEQATAIETLLLTGNTTYGAPSTWNVETLNKLGILPLYLTSNFWSHFKTLDKTTFLRSFVKSLREKNTSKAKLSQLFSASNQISRAKRATGCTTGNITAVTISDEAFPFGYDATQFNACLTADVANTNLAALAQKVVNSDFLTIILNKLNQALPSGFLDVVVQQLGPISQVASLADISKWNITKVDTLASLMSSSDGTWTPDQSNFIITKYLSTQGNALGTAELDSVGGPNLCSLNTTVLRTINSSSLRYANVLDLSNCSTENKKVLFNIVYGTFINQTNSSLTSYQLLQPYIGGAPLKYIQLLSTLNISMDVPTLASLDPNVTMALTVTNVKGLLGKNLPQLKTYENVTLIKNWISSQYKSALTDLGLNFTWGKADVTTAAPASQNSTVASVKNATATTATTKSGAEQTNTLANHILPFVFLVLTTVALHGTAVI